MYKLFLLIGFFIILHILLFVNLIYFAYLGSNKHIAVNQSFSPFTAEPTGVVYAALPHTENLFAVSIGQQDGRIQKVFQFLTSYQSPLAQYASLIVNEADKEGIDFRLIPAISIQESGGCKVIPVNSYNCWGYGIYSGHVTRFDSYENGIIAVTHGLASNYYAKGLDTPEKIMKVYTPPSSGSWAQGINYFFNQL